MKFIEKNEVFVEKLFNWGGELKVVDSYDQEIAKVYIRLVGDTDLNKARVYGLRKSAELRKQLRTEGSDERLAYIPDLDLTEIPNLIEIIVSQESRTLVGEVMKEIEFILPPELDSDATLEEQEEYQKVVDEWPDHRQERIETLLMEKLEQERKRLAKLPKESLVKEYETYLINNLCEDEMYSKYMEMCAYYGTYLDKEYKTRLFKDFEQFANLPLAIKNQFINFYSGLDIKMDELKK